MKIKIFLLVLVLLAMICYNYVLAQEYVTAGLVAFWTFDSSTISGDTVKDVKNNIKGKMADTKTVEGKIKEALEFNGKSSMVTIDKDARLDITDAITIEAWIKINEWLLDPNRNVIFARYDQAANKRGLQFSLNPDNGLAVYMGYSNGTVYYQTQKGGQSQDWVGKWVHVAVTWDHSDSGLAILYVDGKELNSYESQQALKEPLLIFDIPWVIGAMPAQSRFFSGAIDELRVYNRRLSDDEVMRNFNVKMGYAVQSGDKLTQMWGKVKLIP